jgi:cold shock protein
LPEDKCETVTSQQVSPTWRKNGWRRSHGLFFLRGCAPLFINTLLGASMTTTDTTRHSGTVKFFGGHSGNYGFLMLDSGAPDVFVHRSALDAAGLKTLDEGQRVEFSIEADKFHGKPKAVQLKLI